MRLALVIGAFVILACGDDTGGDAGPVDESHCVPERCNGRDDDCDGLVDEDFSFSDDSNNCGACGVTCRVPNGSGVCSQAACQPQVLACDPFFDNCDGDGSNGCEGDLLSDTHCGSCGSVCERTNATASCAAGACELRRCLQGFDDCDDDEANGCETALTSLAHCGACGTPCTQPNALMSCETGECTFVACSEGYDDCDDNPETGCETSLTSDDHCGACDQPCIEGDACVEQLCVPT